MNGRWAGCLIAAIHFGLAGRGRAEFGFDDVRARAAALAAQPYRDSYPQVPATWMNLPPAKYAGVHFDDRKARWREEKLPFALEFYPPGIFHKQIVIIHEIDSQGVREIPFDPGVFIGPDPKVQLPTSPGYAGFRIERIILLAAQPSPAFRTLNNWRRTSAMDRESNW
jgi:glucans biosynthesis protein